MSEQKPVRRVRRIEVDPRAEEIVTLFQRYGETVLSHFARQTGRVIDPAMLTKVNKEVEPMLRSRIEALVKDYLLTACESLTGEAIDPEEVGYRVQFPRRRRYHLRFLTLSFADLVMFDETAEGAKGKKDKIFSKTLLDGIDCWSRHVLTSEEMEAANRFALRALDRLEITAAELREDDRDLWRRLHEMPDAMQLIGPVLLPLLRPFHEDFEGARTQMQRLIGNGSEGRVQLDARMWDLLFARIFGRLLRFIGAEERPDLATEMPPAGRQLIKDVTARYRQWRTENRLK